MLGIKNGRQPQLDNIRTASRHGAVAGPGACPCSAASAATSPRVPRSAGRPVTCGPDATRGAQAGSVRPPTPPAARGEGARRGTARQWLRSTRPRGGRTASQHRHPVGPSTTDAVTGTEDEGVATPSWSFTVACHDPCWAGIAATAPYRRTPGCPSRRIPARHGAASGGVRRGTASRMRRCRRAASARRAARARRS